MEDPNGWEIYASQKQRGRSSWRSIAATLGRQLPPTPEHLSRVLYIPRHDDTTSHLPLYDISSQYSEAIGDAPMGSSKYTVSLGMMKRPKGDGTDHIPVVYIVNFTAGAKDKVVGRVEYRVQPDSTVTDNAEAEITIGNTDDEACSIKVNGDSAQPTDPVAVGISYPIPPSETKVGTVKHPYFHFRMPFESEMIQFDWQVHPVELGPLRYTLVRMPLEGTESSDENNTEHKAEAHAIYHHIGLGVSMSESHSEGVLLLPPCTDPKLEAIVVASVLGMLWWLRSLKAGRRNKKNSILTKKSIFGSP